MIYRPLEVIQIFGSGGRTDERTKVFQEVLADLKKGKLSKFNPLNDEQVKSSPALNVWSHEGSNLYPKKAQLVKTDM